MSEKERDKLEEDFNANHKYEIEIKSTQTNVTHNGQKNGYENNVKDPH